MRIDLDNHIRGVLKAFGLKVGKISTGQFEARVWELIGEGDAQIRWVVGTMLTTRAAVISQLALLQRAVLAVARHDQVCRRLMTVPGVGAVTALAFKTAVDEPAQFQSSAALGAYFGLTPSKYASGETDVTGHITKCGDKAVQVLLCEAANALLTRVGRWSWVKRWGLEVLKRRGKIRAQIAALTSAGCACRHAPAHLGSACVTIPRWQAGGQPALACLEMMLPNQSAT